MQRLCAVVAWCTWLMWGGVSDVQAQASQPPLEIFAQTGHPTDRSDVALAVAPDGLRLASVSVDFPTVKIWDVASQREWRTLRGHSGGLWTVAYAPDGRLLASGGSDKTIRLWDAATGSALKVLEGHASWVAALAFTPDGRTVISSSADKTVRLWDVGSGQFRRSLPLPKGLLVGETHWFTALAVSADGRLVAAVGDPGAIVIWNLAAAPTAAPRLLKLAFNRGKPTRLALSPDGQRLAFIQQVDGVDRVHLWDVQTGRELATAQGARKSPTADSASLRSLAFAADGLVASDSDRSIHLWDADLRQPPRVIATTGVSWVGTDVAFMPGGQTIALATHDGMVSLWDRVSGRNVTRLGGVTSMVKSLALSPDGKTLVAGGRGRHLEQWSTADGRRVRRVPAFDDQIVQVAIAPNGASVMASCYGSCVRETQSSYRVRSWRLSDGQQVKDLNMLSPLAMAPDGKTYASFYPGSNSVPGIWRTHDDSMACKLPGRVGEEGWYYFAEFSPDSRYLAVGYQKGKVIVWDVPNCRHVRTIQTRSDGDGAPPVSFSPDSRLLSTGCASAGLSRCRDTAVRTYRVEDGQLVAEFNARGVAVYRLRHTPDGRLLIGAAGDEIKVWDAASGAERRSWTAHSGGVTELVLSADGRLLYTSGNDGSIRRWDLATATEQAQFISFSDGEWVVITPQGYYDSSERGDHYLNVRVGQQVFGMASYRERFYRPDVVRLALDGRTAAGSNLAQVGVAPQVSLLGVPETVQGDSLNLQIQVLDQGGGIGEVRVYLNGTAVQGRSTRNLQPEAAPAGLARPVRLNLPVRLLPGSNQIQVLAFNADGSMSGNPAKATVQSLQASGSAPVLPRLHALVVGIQEFENSRFNLKYTRVDAEAMQKALQARSQGLFGAVNIQLLTDRGQTTKEAIRAAFASMREQVAPDDVFVFYVASHGVIDGENLADMSYYLVTSNVGSAATRYLKRDALSQDELRSLIADVPATKKLVLLDTCHAGDVGSRLLGRGLEQDAAVKLLSRSTGVAVIAASTSAQQALEGHMGHGVFTYALLQGLSGKADAGRKGYVTPLSLADYVTEQVPELTERVFKMKQYPTFNIEGQPFPIVRTP